MNYKEHEDDKKIIWKALVPIVILYRHDRGLKIPRLADFRPWKFHIFDCFESRLNYHFKKMSYSIKTEKNLL